MTTPYAAGAPAYADAGYTGVIPVRLSQKQPALAGVTGREGNQTGPGWFAAPGTVSAYADHNIGWRLPAGYLGIDVDAYEAKHGAATLSALEAALGPLPRTYISTSRTDGISGIRIFQVPENMHSRGLLTAPQPDGTVTADVEVVQHHHRFVVVWPSVHRTGHTYRWLAPDGSALPEGSVPDPSQIPHMPVAWTRHLSTPQAQRTEGARLGVAEFQGVCTESTKPSALSVVARSFTGIAGSRHDTMFKALCWAAREAAAGLYSAPEAFGVLRGLWEAATAGEGRTAEFDVMLADACASVSPEDARRVRQRISGMEIPAMELFEYEQPAPEVPRHLPDSFWTARPFLSHVRQASHARLDSPDGVLMALAARTAAMLPPQLRVDTGIKSPVSLNMVAALVAPPGVGKSSAASRSQQILEVPEYLKIAGFGDGLPLGSGEGVTASYYGQVEEETEQAMAGADMATDSRKGRKRVIHKKVRDNNLFVLDEGSTLAEMAGRKGSTILSVLRTAAMGGTLGQANAAVENRRILPGGDYSFGLTVNYQPKITGNLFSEVEQGVGTPQRFFFARADDPTIPLEEVDDPGPLSLDFKEILTGESGPGADPFMPPSHVGPDAGAIRPMSVPAAERARIRSEHVAVNTGQLARPVLDAHEPVMIAKLAGILAVWDGRRDTSTSDWDLARLWWSVSCAVRGDLVSEIVADERTQARQRDDAKVDVAARSAVAVEEALADRSSNLTATVAAKFAELVHQRGALKRRDLQRSLSPAQYAVRKDAEQMAADMDWLIVSGADITPGASRPGADV